MNPAAFASPPGACALGAEGGFGPDRISRTVYDAESRMLQQQRAYLTQLQQNEATFTYSPNGKRISVTDANGNRAEMRYDRFDRQDRWTFPSATTPGQVNAADYEEYGYDILGNRTSVRRRDGTTITYQYDPLNRVSLKTVPTSASGAAGYSVHYGYDVGNRQLYARFGSAGGAGITNTYDSLGRLVSSSNTMNAVNWTLGYQYDLGGRRSRLTFPDLNYFAYDYDAAGLLTAIRENGATAVASFSYDTAGRPSGWTAGGTATAYGYDPVSRLLSLGHDLASTAADQNLTFSYNPSSQITSRTSANVAYASNTAYDVNRAYAVNGLNQYTTAGPATFSYDANGNLTSDGATNFVYDAENRLVSATGARNATLVYDPLGRLFETAAGVGTTRFLHDGDELVSEYSIAGSLQRRYAHGYGSDDPVLWYEGSGLGQRRSLHADHQGSIVAVADSAGAATAINGYDAWGIPNAANQGRFQYTGQAWLPELGLYYYKARIYSPTLGRFLQTDPIGYEGGVNLYAYVANDPINFVDITGENPRPRTPPPPMGHNRPPRDPTIVPAITRIERRILEMDPTYRTPQVVGSLGARDVEIAQQNLRDRSVLGFGGSRTGNNLNDAAMQMVLGRSEYQGSRIGGSRGPTYQFTSSGNARSDFNFLSGGNFTTRSNGSLNSGSISLGNGNAVTYNLHVGNGVGRNGNMVLQGIISSTIPGSRIMRNTRFKIEY